MCNLFQRWWPRPPVFRDTRDPQHPGPVLAIQVVWDDLDIVSSQKGHKKFGKIPNVL